MHEGCHLYKLSFMRTRQILRLPAKGSLPLKRYNFLRINSRNQPFIYTQKKKFSQYLCFLIKSTILHISLSNFSHELYYRNFTCTCYCVTNNASIRLYQPNFKMHDVHVLRYTGRFFSHKLLDIERELFLLQ